MERRRVPVTVCVPSIPPRKHELDRALNSIDQQTVLVERVVEIDAAKTGACATRNRCLTKVETEFVAFLDDDDQFLPDHVESLYDFLVETGSDMVYPLMRIANQNGQLINPLGVFGGTDFEFNPDRLLRHNFIPITVLARTAVLRRAGGFEHLNGFHGEDHGMWLKLLYYGFKITHLPKVTWQYNWWGKNTSGLPSRW